MTDLKALQEILEDIIKWAKIGLETAPRGKTIPDIEWCENTIRAHLQSDRQEGGEKAVEPWQDVSTAPKDGTWIILWASKERTIPVVGCWEKDGWFSEYVEIHTATHWQRLPETPCAS